MAVSEDDLIIRLDHDVDPAPALTERQASTRTLLERLAVSPPQVLLLEGGNAQEREALSLYWAARLNCFQPGSPCLACPDCLRILSGAHPDFYVLDGAARSIKVDQVREIVRILGELPRGEGFRVIALAEAQGLTPAAANCLLKSLEEPRDRTVFLILAPQRERLLPTLVSRSWTLTLPWPGRDQTEKEDPRLTEWMAALEAFAGSGRGWFERTGSKGAVDRPLAHGLVLRCQRELAQVLTGEAATAAGLPAERLGPERLRRLDVALDECREALDAGVNPALVLDRLAVQLYQGLE